MRYILSSILCLTLSGCGFLNTYHYKQYAYRAPEPSDVIQAIPHIQASEHYYYVVPFIYGISTRSSPYHLELTFRSKKKPKKPIIITKVEIQNTDGKNHQLTNEPIDITSWFNKRLYTASPRNGSYQCDIYEKKLIFKDIPLDFSKKDKCIINLEFTDGEEMRTNNWSMVGSTKSKTMNIISDLSGR